MSQKYFCNMIGNHFTFTTHYISDFPSSKNIICMKFIFTSYTFWWEILILTIYNKVVWPYSRYYKGPYMYTIISSDTSHCRCCYYVALSLDAQGHVPDTPLKSPLTEDQLEGAWTVRGSSYRTLAGVRWCRVQEVAAPCMSPSVGTSAGYWYQGLLLDGAWSVWYCQELDQWTQHRRCRSQPLLQEEHNGSRWCMRCRWYVAAPGVVRAVYALRCPSSL